jgi:hypothetical protein
MQIDLKKGYAHRIMAQIMIRFIQVIQSKKLAKNAEREVFTSDVHKLDGETISDTNH